MNIQLEYEKWLIKKINNKKDNYNLLLHELNIIPFEVAMERDLNRIDDAFNIRDTFFYEQGINGNFVVEYISVLEVLIALSVRIDNEYVGNPGDPHPEIIFWDLMHNLNLEKYDNSHFNKREIYNNIYIWMHREFDFDGSGSIFPLRNPLNDQRHEEIWSQMTAYLSENF